MTSTPPLCRAEACADAEASPCREPGDGDASSLLYVHRSDGDAALDCLRTHGAVVLREAVPEEALQEARTALAPFLAAAAAAWDADSDSLSLKGSYGISRLPRVNNGKKNVHFSDGSALHSVLAKLAAAAGVAELLSAAHGAPLTLSESGLSLTRAGGSGMEWHSDGGEGENTVLLSLEDQPAERGALGFIPGSHVMYEPGQDVAEQRKATGRNALWFPYEAGSAAVIDARVLHAAADNTSAQQRAVVWYIYN
jgi:ectoine hydroxylase-related dioxygenase (phytanoyl-CoA dioxygenase family)